MHTKHRLPSLVKLTLLALVSLQTLAARDDDNNGRSRLKFKELDAPAGATFMLATGGNRDGWVVGYYGTNTGVRGFLLKKNRFSDASLPSTTAYTVDSSFPIGVTSNGVVAGMAYDTDGYGHAYTRAGSTVTEIVYPGSNPGATQIRSVSSDGKILGDASLPVEPYNVTFVYKNGVFTTLTVPANPPAPDIYWTSINNKGQLLGTGNGPSGRVYVVAKQNNYRVLPALPGNYEANTISLTDSGVVALDAFDLDNYLGPDLGQGSVGLLLREGRWTKVRAPKDTLGVTHVSAATDLDDEDEQMILGSYWDATRQQFVAYTAQTKD